MATSSDVHHARLHAACDTSKLSFRGIQWNIWVSFGSNNTVTFTVWSIPRLRLRLGRYARTMANAKISMEILDGSGKPAAWADQREHMSTNGTAWIVDRIHVQRSERAARDDRDSFRFRCTVSEDDVRPGIFSKMKNCWKPSKVGV